MLITAYVDTAHVELGIVYDLHVFSMYMCFPNNTAQQHLTAVTSSCYIPEADSSGFINAIAIGHMQSVSFLYNLMLWQQARVSLNDNSYERARNDSWSICTHCTRDMPVCSYLAYNCNNQSSCVLVGQMASLVPRPPIW